MFSVFYALGLEYIVSCSRYWRRGKLDNTIVIILCPQLSRAGDSVSTLHFTIASLHALNTDASMQAIVLDYCSLQ
jgi:hypothetical protein